MKKFLPAFLLFIPSLALAQADHRGEEFTSKPEYRGIKASAPIPPEMHVRNEGGSDNLGLCVISSVLSNGLFQKVPGLNVPGRDGQAGKGSKLWLAAKAAPGGYSPQKLEQLLNQVMPGEKWASYTGTGSEKDRDLLEKINRAGFPVGVTMNTGRTYNYAYIHHMVSLLHYRKNGWTCLSDNNKPHAYSWMPSSEFDRRWPDTGTAWAFWWTRLPSKGVAAGGLSLILIAAAILIVVEVKSRETQEPAS